MNRFQQFSHAELAIIRTAMIFASSDFYDPGISREERAKYEDLVTEVSAAIMAPEPVEAESVQPQERETAKYDPTAQLAALAGAPAEEIAEAVNTAMTEIAEGAEQELKQHRTAPTACQPGKAINVWKEPGRPADKTPTRETPRRTQIIRSGEYSGFLYIQCSKCGDIRAFCAKMPMSKYRCRECGGVTPLEPMEELKVSCECGRSYRYMTNVQADKFDVNCFNCGCPVPVEWAWKRQRYEPIGYTQNKRGRRKK